MKVCAFYQEHGKRSRWKHLNNRLRIAQEQEDKEAFSKISTITQREQQRNFWQKLNFMTGKKSHAALRQSRSKVRVVQ
jgi:hypothetical protein